MECPNCEMEFEGEERIPRILPHCGHSLCQSCLKTLWRQRQILCPQCGKSSTADSPDSFPINHSLIQLRLKDASSLALCPRHGKALEAFCMMEKEGLCLVCILGDVHKKHDVLALNQAAEKEREVLSSLAIKILQQEQEMSYAELKIEQTKTALAEEMEKTKDSLRKVFELVKEVLEQRQNAVFEKLEADFRTEKRNLAGRGEEIQRKQYLLQALKAEISKTEDETDLDLLLKSKDRDTVSKAALAPLKSIPQPKTLADSSREGELNTIWRQVRERFLRLGSQSPVKKSVPVTITSLEQARDARKSRTGNVLAASAEEDTIRRMKRSDGRKLSPATSLGMLKSPALKVTVHPARRIKSPLVKAGRGTGLLTKRNPFRERFSSPQNKSDFSSDMEETPVHTHTVDLSSFMTLPAAYIYTLGGFSDGVTFVCRYDCRGDVWETLSVQLARTLCGCVLTGDGSVLLLGGKLNGKRVHSSDTFLPSRDQLLPGPINLRTSRSGFACVRIDQAIYCLGGSDGVPLKTAEMWDGQNWKDLSHMQYRRDELAGVVGPDGYIYVFGGYGGTDM